MDNREMDKLVASKLMGWKVKSIQTSERSWQDAWVNQEEKILAWYREWKPSTDIAAAWQVAETLEQRFGCDVNIEIRRKSMNKVWTGERWERKRYYVTISGGNLGYDSFNCTFTIYDDSPCVAICHAALKAIESEVKEEAE